MNVPGFTTESLAAVQEMLYGESPWEQQFLTGKTTEKLPRENKTTHAQSLQGMDIDSRPGKQKGSEVSKKSKVQSQSSLFLSRKETRSKAQDRVAILKDSQCLMSWGKRARNSRQAMRKTAVRGPSLEAQSNARPPSKRSKRHSSKAKLSTSSLSNKYKT